MGKLQIFFELEGTGGRKHASLAATVTCQVSNRMGFKVLRYLCYSGVPVRYFLSAGQRSITCRMMANSPR